MAEPIRIHRLSFYLYSSIRGCVVGTHPLITCTKTPEILGSGFRKAQHLLICNMLCLCNNFHIITKWNLIYLGVRFIARRQYKSQHPETKYTELWYKNFGDDSRNLGIITRHVHCVHVYNILSSHKTQLWLILLIFLYVSQEQVTVLFFSMALSFVSPFLVDLHLLNSYQKGNYTKQNFRLSKMHFMYFCQGCNYLIKNTVKTVLLWNSIVIYLSQLFSILIYFTIVLFWQSWFFINHYPSLQCYMIFQKSNNLLNQCSRNLSYYYHSWK